MCFSSYPQECQSTAQDCQIHVQQKYSSLCCARSNCVPSSWYVEQGYKEETRASDEKQMPLPDAGVDVKEYLVPLFIPNSYLFTT